MTLSRRIPPLNSLRVFESAARLGHLTMAVEELNVSQSAVSRQILLLESYLGVRLFQREARGASLTKIGSAYHGEIGPAFALIAKATAKIQRPALERTPRIRAYTTFAAKSLLPHLPNYEARHPDISVQLSTGAKPADFETGEQDLSIEFSMDRHAAPNAVKLFADVIEPVCSPHLLDRRYPLNNPADLDNYKLLHSHYRTADWPDWLQFAECAQLVHKTGLTTLPSSLLAYQAAIDGLGIAMGQIRLLGQELASGRLITPFNRPLQRAAGYYLVASTKRKNTPQMAMFREWIREEIAHLNYPFP